MSAPPASEAEKRPVPRNSVLHKRCALAQGVLATAGIAVAFLCLFLPLENPDIFWHLSAAREIIAAKALPTADFLSWSKAGQPWVDFEWLPQLFYYVGWSLFGYGGLLACKILLLLPLFYVFYLTARLYTDKTRAFLALPVLAAVLLPSMDLRPENFSLLFFALLLYWLERARSAASTPLPRRYLWGGVALFSLWANCHGGFVYGLALIGFYCVGELLRVKLPAIYGRKEAEDFSLFRIYAILFCCAAAGTLLNGYGPRIYTVLFDHARELSVIGEHLSEWQAPELGTLAQAPYWALVVFSGAVLAHRAITRRDVDFPLLIAWLFFAVVSSQHVRNTSFFALAALPCLLRLLALYEKDGHTLPGALFRWVFPLFAVLFLGFSLGGYLRGEPWHHSAGAHGTVQYLKSETKVLSGLRMYNPWGWGGYLGFELAPEYKVFQDGRYIFHDFLAQMQAARVNNALWADFLERHSFELVLLERSDTKYLMKVPVGNTGFHLLHFPFYAFFMTARDWALVYWDSRGMVFVRRGSVPGKWLEENELDLLKPDNLEALRAKLGAGMASPADLDAEAARLEKQLRYQGLNKDADEIRAYTQSALSPSAD